MREGNASRGSACKAIAEVSQSSACAGRLQFKLIELGQELSNFEPHWRRFGRETHPDDARISTGSRCMFFVEVSVGGGSGAIALPQVAAVRSAGCNVRVCAERCDRGALPTRSLGGRRMETAHLRPPRQPRQWRPRSASTRASRRRRALLCVLLHDGYGHDRCASPSAIADVRRMEATDCSLGGVDPSASAAPPHRVSQRTSARMIVTTFLPHRSCLVFKREASPWVAYGCAPVRWRC
jgi:hypothetical protein